jgi:undecaprenyl phosphate-alpha-L-ara4FN deformylase
MNIGLRVDVDTYTGTRDGAPSLVKLLSEERILATFFFSVGPDNMGRQLWRLWKPKFLAKMIRSRAVSLYGWDILLRGTFGPGPNMAKLAPVIRDAAKEGHEIGLHAWDHYVWQTKIGRTDRRFIRAQLQRGYETLADILGKPIPCSAAPSWKCDEATLIEKEKFPFAYNSDCRGGGVFRPMVEGRAGIQPQAPATLPTYDEVIGRNGVTAATYNEYLLKQLNPCGLNVLTIHAEVEGRIGLDLFRDFIRRARAIGAKFSPLGRLAQSTEAIPVCRLEKGYVPGREGWVAVQGMRVKR